MFKDCTACADNVAEEQSSEGELWDHIITTHEAQLLDILAHYQLDDYIISDAQQNEWIFALVIEALVSPRSLAARIVCSFLVSGHLAIPTSIILRSDRDVYVDAVRSCSRHAILELDIVHQVSI